jgi:Cdc6-like AAA superfamily ATPase
LPRDGISSEVFQDRIRDHGGQFVAVLDESDLLEDMRVPLALTDLPDVAIVTICLGEDQWLAGSDERIRSTETIELSPFGHAELVDVLEDRVAHGLHGTVTPPTIAEIADRAAGDARVATTMLRQAAKYVDDGQARPLNTQVVDAAEDRSKGQCLRHGNNHLGPPESTLLEMTSLRPAIDSLIQPAG